MITDTQVLHWILKKHRCLPVVSMLAAALDAQGNEELARLMKARTYPPQGAGDFAQCCELLAEIPEVAEHWGAIAAVSLQWARLAAAWPDLQELHMSGATLDFDSRIRQALRGW
jgi:hypothetical protein